jgi:hypothetical protein
MKPYVYTSFSEAITQASHWLQHRSKVVHSERWQGSDIANKPEMAMHEVTHCSFAVDLTNTLLHKSGELKSNALEILAKDIQPNLPWADDHFLERINGVPMNPGTEWANWPYGKSAAQFLEEGQFNHNYMERYWPKYAGMVHVPTEDAAHWKAEAEKEDALMGPMQPRRGVRYEYGDLNDVLDLLQKDPFTRQAYLPIWFPEDTGGGAKRAPCTIGYHFTMREDRLDISYHIRSCDFVRHFRDDLYLTVRLQLWVIDQLAERDDRWKTVEPGRFNMQIGSLHCFRNDYTMMWGK